MRVLRGPEVAAMSADGPADPRTIAQHWLAGPIHGTRLDVCLVTMSAGGVTPRHRHHGGQVLVVTRGDRDFADGGPGEAVHIIGAPARLTTSDTLRRPR